MSEAALVGGQTFASLAVDVAQQLARATTSSDRLTAIVEELRAALPAEPSAVEVARLHRLVTGLGLSPFERDLLVVAGLPHEHPGLSRALADLHPRAVPAATAGLAGSLLCRQPAEWSTLVQALTDGPLVAQGVLTAARGPFPDRSLELAEGLWEALRGRTRWPSGVATEDVPGLIGIGSWRLRTDVAHAVALLGTASSRVLVQVSADDPAEARARAALLCRWAGVPGRHVSGDLGDPGVARLVGLHCLVRGEVPVLAAADLAGRDPLPGLPGPVVVHRTTATPAVATDRPLVPVAVVPLAPAQRAELWGALLPEAPDVAAALAPVHRVSALRAAEATADVRASGEVSVPGVAAALRARAQQQLPAAVRLVTPTADPESLVLDERGLDLLDAAVDRARHQVRVLHEWGLQRGRRGAGGVRLLFAGPPGTGKTYAAEVLAARLGLDLLVVDLSALVSKWLGDTEKHLAEVFDTAEQTQAVLFFDEADALFAKRTDTSDAHARWANLETAYLLGRFEQFDGVAVLASNLRSNIDTAFGRRLDFVIAFDEPDTAARERLWREHLKAPVPLGADVDLARLARLYPLSGGVIRNAALAAAFMAAAEDGPLTADHVLTAVQREYEKTGRSFPGRPAAPRSHESTQLEAENHGR